MPRRRLTSAELERRGSVNAKQRKREEAAALGGRIMLNVPFPPAVTDSLISGQLRSILTIAAKKFSVNGLANRAGLRPDTIRRFLDHRILLRSNEIDRLALVLRFGIVTDSREHSVPSLEAARRFMGLQADTFPFDEDEDRAWDDLFLEGAMTLDGD